jgi:hypothetical protein
MEESLEPFTGTDAAHGSLSSIHDMRYRPRQTLGKVFISEAN